MRQEEAGSLPTQALASGLLQLAAWVKRLENQSHLAHANFTGENFLSVHPYLGERYEEHLAQFDVILELVRTLGYWAPMSDKELMEMSAAFECLCERDGPGMLDIYRKNIEIAGRYVKEIEALAQESRSIDVANEMATIAGQMWKVYWFLGSLSPCH
jgi:DNA-binding ferritin-like protein